MINAIPHNYEYGNYEFGRNNPFGQVNGVGPRLQGTPAIDNSYGIAIPENYSFVDDENGVGISQGKQGVGLAYVDPAERRFFVA